MYRLTGGKERSGSSSMPFIIFSGLILVLIASFGGKGSEAKEAYPSKPITIIVPWAPGSAVDVAPRVMSVPFAKKLGVPVNIVNKPGGSGVPGALEAVKAAPDGQTILSDCPGTSSVQMAWIKDLPYRVEERMYMARAVVCPQAFVVRADAPWKTLQDLEQALRNDPASFRWGAVGTTQSDFGIYLLKAALKKRGVDLSKTKTVSFASATPALTALAGGHIDLYFGSNSLRTYVSAGKARLIAVARSERTDLFPGVPTTVEQGFPSVQTQFWVGYSATPRLPANIVQIWETIVKEIVNDPALLPEWEKMGAIPAYLGKEAFKKFVLEEAKEIEAVTSP